VPLYADHVRLALQKNAAAFQNVQRDLQANLQQLQRGLAQVEELSKADLLNCLQVPRPGALPTDEQDTQPLIVPFGTHWAHHGEARAWAERILRGVLTTAVDGSQIAPNRDVSIPVGLVQIGWFANAHDGSGNYIKDVEIDLLTPEDLSDQNAQFYEVEWRRFRGEIRRTMTLMRAYAGRPAVAFVDGPLIVSFVGRLAPLRQQDYIALMEEMLACSEETRVPVVGYTDSSYASDLVSLISHVSTHELSSISDAALIDARMTWGDRLRWYLCSRDDGIPNTDYYERVAFTYLRSTMDHPPSRLEMPAWVLQAQQHDWVLDVVRAECVVGVGYPYALETADALAVLSSPDREHFYQLLQQFAQREHLPLRFSRKSISKRHRRT
jgi:hypothetical protein